MCFERARLLLFLDGVGAREDERHLREGVGLNGGADAAAAVGKLLADHAALHRVQAQAAVRRRDVRVHEPRLPCLIKDLVWELVRRAGAMG